MSTTGEGFSPSQLCRIHLQNRQAEGVDGNDALDAESSLQNILLALRQQDAHWIFDHHRVSSIRASDLMDWMWPSLKKDQNVSEHNIAASFLPQEWAVAIQYAKELVRQISPFELHALASQALLLADHDVHDVEEDDDNQTSLYKAFCLLLCAYALRQCPSPLQNRYKRWQSILCETIRMVQDCRNEVFQSTTLWVQYICPACLHVVQQLSKSNDVLLVGLFAGLIGTTSTLASDKLLLHHQQYLSTIEDLHRIVETVCSTFQSIRKESPYIELDVWMNPWRSYCWKFQQQRKHEADSYEEVNVDKRKFKKQTQQYQNLSWWIYSSGRVEQVAGMDTSWSDLGISFLAVQAFSKRPVVLHSTFLWKVWFPHVSTLIKDHLSLSVPLLQSLCAVVPEGSLTLESISTSFSDRPDAPLNVFQAISDRMVTAPNTFSVAADKRLHVEQIVLLIRGLMNRYDCTSQVSIIARLVADCPNPGLQARFLDLLRPHQMDVSCQNALWHFLEQQIDSLLAHVDPAKQILMNSGDLVEKVEIYVSVISLIRRLTSKRRPKRPAEGHCVEKLQQGLHRFQTILQEQLCHWSSNPTGAPENYYRLNLLDSALQAATTALN